MTLPRQSLTGAALFASPWLSESMNVSMFFRSASMMGVMLPDTSMRKTMSATPLVLARGATGGAEATSTGPLATSADGVTSTSVIAGAAGAALSAGAAGSAVGESGRGFEVCSDGSIM